MDKTPSVNNDEPRRRFEALVLEAIAAWRGHATWAWAGECGIFAGQVWDLGRAEGIDVPMDSFDNNFSCDSPLPALPGITTHELETLGLGPNHVWLVWDGRHYDAAHPQGVDTPFELRCVRQSLVEQLQDRAPQRLQQLCDEHPWWEESADLANEFAKLHEEREAQYEEN